MLVDLQRPLKERLRLIVPAFVGVHGGHVAQHGGDFWIVRSQAPLLNRERLLKQRLGQSYFPSDSYSMAKSLSVTAA